MVLSGTKKTSSLSSITNQPQGGGSAKAGFFPKVGLQSWTSLAYDSNKISTKFCCPLATLNKMPLKTKNISRPVGTTVRVPKLTPNFISRK
jgi:hypothetical protein